MKRTTMTTDGRRRTRFGRLRLLLPVALAVAAVVAALPGPAQSAFPGQNGKIAFWGAGASQGVWLMDADGSNQQQLTDFGFTPAWSADGKKIAFTGDTDRGGLFVMDADGSNVRQLTDFGRTPDPTWSPDGQKIAFEFNPTGSDVYEIYVVNADGSNLTQLTSNVAGTSRFPAWSPDGQRIAFSSGSLGRYDIYAIGADGSNLTQLTHGSVEGTSNLYPNWSPDGRRIVFASRPDPSATLVFFQIYVMDADGSNRTQLTYDGDHDSVPAWSPDGRKIAFTCGLDVCVMDADGSNRTQLTTTGGLKPDWQPLAPQSTRTAVVGQPINADGSSVFKAGKGVLPVKFTLAVDGVPTCTLPPATIALAKLSGAASGAVNESEYTMPADTGSDFRVDSCHYVYNLNLKSLTAGTYRAKILIEGQTVGSAAFELR